MKKRDNNYISLQPDNASRRSLLKASLLSVPSLAFFSTTSALAKPLTQIKIRIAVHDQAANDDNLLSGQMSHHLSSILFSHMLTGTT